MRHRQRKRRSPARLAALTVLIFCLVAVILARTGAEHKPAEVATAPQKETAPRQESAEQLTIKLEDPDILPASSPDPEPDNTPVAVDRYADVATTEEELRDLAAIVYLEAGNQSAEGQQAVVEVILNRVIAGNFPDSVHDVLYQGAGTKVPQFSTIGLVATIEPGQAQYDAISAALYGPSILPDDVVFFSRGGENDRTWGKIEDHVFCYQYVWG